MPDTHKPTTTLVATKREREATFALQMATQARKFGARIAELRIEKRWKQRTLVEKMTALGDKSLNTNQLSRYENGGAMPGEQRQAWFASALGTTVADLVAGPVEEREEPEVGDLDQLNADASELRALDAKLDRVLGQVAELAGAVAGIQATERALQERLQQLDRRMGERRSD